MAKMCMECKSKIGNLSNYGSDYYPLCFSCHTKKEKLLENKKDQNSNEYKKSTSIIDFRDTKYECWARVNLADSTPLFISMSRNGALIRKSKIGFFGTKLYEEKILNRIAEMGVKILTYLEPVPMAGQPIRSKC